MLIWLLILLLMSMFIYVIYRISFLSKKEENKRTDHHYTFKIYKEQLKQLNLSTTTLVL